MSPIPERINRHRPMGSFYIRAHWESKWVLWPRRCLISNKILWPGTRAYCGRATWHGPGEPVLETHWHSLREHLIWQLKE